MIRLKVTSRVAPAWSTHKRNWQGCTDCAIGKRAFKTVLARGQLPCDVLFVGEAPGKDEDTVGYPFVGRSGRLLDHWIEEALRQSSRSVRLAITNLVSCRPCDAKAGPNRKPTEREVHRCTKRLEQFFELASPSSIVFVGKTASNQCAVGTGLPGLHLYHPAYVLRNGGKNTTFSRDQIFLLTEFLEAHYDG